MNFDEVKVRVSDFLHDSRNGDPSDFLNEYFASIPKKRRIREAEELLTLLANGTARPQTKEDILRSGNPGVIALGMPHAYPLLLTVLGWWVYAVYDTRTATELTLEEKLALHKDLKDGISRWDWQGYDANRYDHLLNRLIPPNPPKEQEIQSGFLQGIIRRLKLFFCSS